MIRYALVLTICGIFFTGCEDSKSAGEKFGEAVKKIRENQQATIPHPVIIEDKNESKKDEEKNSSTLKVSEPKSLMDIAIEAKQAVKKVAKESGGKVSTEHKDSEVHIGVDKP